MFPTKITLIMLLLILSLIGCSSPDVRQSFISPEVKSVPAWAIVLADEYQIQDSLVAVDQIERMFKSKYADKEYCRPYLDSLKENLNSTGHIVVDAADGVGQIILSIRGRKFSDRVDWNSDIDSEQQFRRRHHQDSPADRSIGETSGAINYTSYIFSDEIAEIKVELIDVHKRSLGEVTISNSSIKPDFVASVIDKIIRNGKY